MNKWISVKDRLPEAGEPVLLVCDGTVYCGSKWSGESNRFYVSEQNDYEVATHWQPLPEPPEAEEE